jgi:hypothetical protein
MGTGIFCCFARPSWNALNVLLDDFGLHDDASPCKIPVVSSTDLPGTTLSIDEGTKKSISIIPFLDSHSF